MKKYIVAGVGAIFALMLIVAGAPAKANAVAGVQWNGTQYGANCPTVGVVNYTTGQGMSGCWGSSATADAGQTINVHIFYFNSGDDIAHNTTLRITPPPAGPVTDYTFNGYISSPGASTSGSGSIHLTSAQTLTLNNVVWYPDGKITPSGLPNGQTASAYTSSGVNIGDIWGVPDCAATHNAKCHAGYVTASFIVGNAVAPTCKITTLSATPSSVAYNGSSSIVWNTSGCTSVNVSGPGYSSSQPNGSTTTGPLTNNVTYTVNANGTSGPTQTQSVTVTVGTAQTCAITAFSANPTSVTSGGSSTLNWNTTNCNTVSVSGPSGTLSTQKSGQISTGTLTQTSTFNIVAYGTNGQVTYPSVTVTVNGTSGGTCSIDSFVASPTSVNSGGTSTLVWNTTGCVSVSVYGTGVASALKFGSIPTPALYYTTTYTISAYGQNGIPLTQNAIVTVNTVNPNPTPTTCVISSFIGNPSTVSSGSSSTLSWVTNNCTNLTLSGGAWGNTPVYSTSMTTQPLYQSTTYTLMGYGTSGTPVTSSTTVNVQNVTSNCAINSFYASPSQVASGGSSTLYWNTTGCTNVTVNGTGLFGGTVSALSNSLPIGPIYNTTTYTINAYGTGGYPVTQSAVVTVFNNQTNTAPAVTTSPASNISDRSATLNGYVSTASCPTPIYTGGYTVPNPCYYPPVAYGTQNVNYYFMYGTSQYALNQQTPTQTLPNGSGSISAYTTNLLPNTTYYFQAVAQNSYGTNYGTVLSFVTTGNTASQISAITTVATNITGTSARLNGLVTGTANYPINTYFEYGTSPSLGTQTGLQAVSTYNVTNYFDTITTVPNTTYYYRIVAISNGQTYPGATVSFTSAGGTTVVPPVVITRVINTGTGGGSSYVALSITDQAQTFLPGDMINYVVTYQNISGVTLSNANLDVILPTGVTYRSSSQGVLTTNNTVHIVLGTLLPNQPPATINISAMTDVNLKPANNFVTTATLAFTTPSRSQDSAIAYVLNGIGSQNNLAGLALFGVGFFPNSLLGWILLIGLLLILILIARYFYHRANADRAAMAAPVTHVHYDNAPHTNYPNNNLPH